MYVIYVHVKSLITLIGLYIIILIVIFSVCLVLEWTLPFP